jgi:hypothetical protein
MALFGIVALSSAPVSGRSVPVFGERGQDPILYTGYSLLTHVLSTPAYPQRCPLCTTEFCKPDKSYRTAAFFFWMITDHNRFGRLLLRSSVVCICRACLPLQDAGKNTVAYPAVEITSRFIEFISGMQEHPDNILLGFSCRKKDKGRCYGCNNSSSPECTSYFALRQSKDRTTAIFFCSPACRSKYLTQDTIVMMRSALHLPTSTWWVRNIDQVKSPFYPKKDHADTLLTCCKCTLRYYGTMVCSVCSVARYCSRSCQKEDWKEHKLECKKWEEDTFGPIVPLPSLEVTFRAA